MIKQIKRMARRSKTAIICYRIYDNYRMQRRFSQGQIDASMGSTHSFKNIDESLAYIDAQFQDYQTYAGLTPDKFAGKRIMELGCGDNVGVALKFLIAGAAQVVCLDKYYSVRDEANEREIYLRMKERLSAEEVARFDKIVDLSKGISFDPHRLLCVYGKDLGEYAAEAKDEEDKFDVILSRAVIE